MNNPTFFNTLDKALDKVLEIFPEIATNIGFLKEENAEYKCQKLCTKIRGYSKDKREYENLKKAVKNSFPYFSEDNSFISYFDDEEVDYYGADVIEVDTLYSLYKSERKYYLKKIGHDYENGVLLQYKNVTLKFT